MFEIYLSKKSTKLAAVFVLRESVLAKHHNTMRALWKRCMLFINVSKIQLHFS